MGSRAALLRPTAWLALWWRISASLWFVPAVMVLAALVLAIALIELEDAHGLDLAAVASSMITVAGVVFSVTIVALSLGASAYSPRVLRTFMGDRPTQMVLGMFVGVFAYCLTVLRTIRTGDDEDFVPRIAVLGGIVLAFAAIAFLVFFIHHLAASIQAATILERITGATLRAIDQLFPEDLGGPAEEADPARLGAELSGAWTPVLARRSGYIVTVDNEALLAFAREHGRVLRMERAIGDFVVRGAVLASLQGAQAVGEDAEGALDRHYTLDRLRTIEQDAAFGVQEIVDIGVKALSPGINDPTTAVMCIDRLTQILVCLSRRRIETPLRSEGDRLRVIAIGPSFTGLAALCYDALRTEARGSPVVLHRLLWSLEEVVAATRHPARLRCLERHARAIAECASSVAEAPAREAIVARAQACAAQAARCAAQA